MKKNDIHYAKALIKAALEEMFPDASFEVAVSLIEGDSHVRSFKPTTLGDFAKIGLEPTEEPSRHFFVTLHPQSLLSYKAKGLLKSLKDDINKY